MRDGVCFQNKKTESEPSDSGSGLERSCDRMSAKRLLQKSRCERYAVRSDVGSIDKKGAPIRIKSRIEAQRQRVRFGKELRQNE